VQLVVSIRAREQQRDVTGDPWNGRTLEWSTASPPPAWNFAVLPLVTAKDAFWQRKRANQAPPTPEYQPIEMPTNAPIGFATAFFAVVTGFALIWHIWWLAGFGILGLLLANLFFAFRVNVEIEIPAEELARFDATHRAELAL
jgi:cytochrome o ubiquinol oxidase subunit I